MCILSTGPVKVLLDKDGISGHAGTTKIKHSLLLGTEERTKKASLPVMQRSRLM